MANTYSEDNIQESGVVHTWHNTSVKDSLLTRRGTKLEMVERSKWGTVCYMDGKVQSAEIDEKYYHEALVHPVMSSISKRARVMIIGGGEGATAREVLKWPDVECVDMYEWDEDVVQLFKEKYPKWAKNAWNDSRLAVHYDDIFEAILHPPDIRHRYDVVIIDLFEPDNNKQWKTLIKSLHKWVNTTGALVMYAGMRNLLAEKQPYETLIHMIQFVELKNGLIVHDASLNKEITPYRVYIPSFLGEAVFLLLRHPHSPPVCFDKMAVASHITDDIWKSYKTLNWTTDE